MGLQNAWSSSVVAFPTCGNFAAAKTFLLGNVQKIETSIVSALEEIQKVGIGGQRLG